MNASTTLLLAILILTQMSVSANAETFSVEGRAVKTGGIAQSA